MASAVISLYISKHSLKEIDREKKAGERCIIKGLSVSQGELMYKSCYGVCL